MSTVAEIGKELRRIRRAKDLRQEDIQGISTVTISRFEGGARGLTRFESLERYAQALGYELVLQKREGSADE